MYKYIYIYIYIYIYLCIYIKYIFDDYAYVDYSSYTMDFVLIFLIFLV